MSHRWGTGVVVLSLLLLAARPAASSERVAASLRPDGVAFWDSGAALGEFAAGKCSSGSCQDFVVQVRATAERLRVAVDGDGTQSPTLQIYDTTGKLAASGTNSYSEEAYVPFPSAGRYVVRVISNFRAKFRLRAKLERKVFVLPRDARAILPNLQLVPPFEFTMSSTTGGQDLGCNAYEKVEYAAHRCLRFSLGPANVGDGALILEFPAMSGMVTPEPVYQLVQHGDGSVTRRQAGAALWHKTHAHHHHQGFGSLELLKVTDATRGRMVAVGTGPKQGFCMLDFLIADWRSFRNAKAGSVRQDCALADGPTATQLGLGAGWADIYVYGLDGNYVEFGTNGDGRYVVRSVADARNDVIESNEQDNAGYAYIEIHGNSVRVLERGHGTSPWDPHKWLADDLLAPNA